MKNYYDILEISEKASQEVIEKVYKVLAKKYHPDLNQGNKEEAERKFKEVSEAYETLSNPEKRRNYDAKLQIEKAQQSNVNNSSFNNLNQNDEYDYYELYDGTVVSAAEYRHLQKMEAEMNAKLQKSQREMARQYNSAYNNAISNLGNQLNEEKFYKNDLSKFTNMVLIVFFIVAIIVVLTENLNNTYNGDSTNNPYYSNYNSSSNTYSTSKSSIDYDKYEDYLNSPQDIFNLFGDI